MAFSVYQSNGEVYESQPPNSPQISLQGEAKLKKLLRIFVTAKLREKHFDMLADGMQEEIVSLFGDDEEVDVDSDRLLRLIERISQERSEHFDSLINRMDLNQESARRMYRGTIITLFDQKKSWSSVILVIAFTADVCVYCARYNMGEQITEILQAADSIFHDRLVPWMLEHGGWVRYDVFLFTTTHRAIMLEISLKHKLSLIRILLIVCQ